MFTISDFWNILDYLGGKDVTSLDNISKVISESERGKSAQLFENTLDQVPFSTNDYNRLRNFFIDWYASHRTIISVEQHSSDVYSLPDAQITELINSFGYVFPIENLSNTTKINLFLDLVNLYKIKGTPTAIRGILGYYGLSDVDLFEYWLQKDESGNLVFRSENISDPESQDSPVDINFDDMIVIDPHWRLSRSDIEESIRNNTIALPSKSPYFGIRPVTNLTTFTILMSQFIQIMQGIYESSLITPLPRDILIGKLNIYVSILELFIACLYSINKYSNRTIGSSDSRIIYYDSTSTDTDEILTLFNSLNVRPTSRSSRDSQISYMESIFTKPYNEVFLYGVDLATMLDTLNHSFKSTIDSWFHANQGFTILSYLMSDLNTWYSTNVTTGYSLSNPILGFGSFIDLLKVIDFFKPYKARVISFEAPLIVNEPLKDSLTIEDSFSESHSQYVVDFDTANGIPCCDSTTCNQYSRLTFDCGNNYDVGASDDKDGPEIEISDSLTDILNYHTSDSTSYTFIEYTLDIGGDVDFVMSSGGFPSMDLGGILDSPHGNDIVEIYVENV